MAPGSTRKPKLTAKAIRRKLERSRAHHNHGYVTPLASIQPEPYLMKLFIRQGHKTQLKGSNARRPRPPPPPPRKKPPPPPPPRMGRHRPPPPPPRKKPRPPIHTAPLLPCSTPTTKGPAIVTPPHELCPDETALNQHSLVPENPIHPYMTDQPHIDSTMRAHLVSRLLDVSWSLGVGAETECLAVDILDRFLSKAIVKQSDLLRAGAVSIMIAHKCLERLSFTLLQDLVHLTDQEVSIQDLKQMELSILKAIRYRVTFSSPHCFLDRYLQGMTPEVCSLSVLLLQQTLKSYRLRCQYRPSQLAAAAVYMARTHYLDRACAWPTALGSLSGYDADQVGTVAQAVIRDRCFVRLVAWLALVRRDQGKPKPQLKPRPWCRLPPRTAKLGEDYYRPERKRRQQSHLNDLLVRLEERYG